MMIICRSVTKKAGRTLSGAVSVCPVKTGISFFSEE